MLRRLIRAAAELGVEVHYSHLDDPDVLGCYDHANKRIHLAFDLTPDERRSTLAHEIAHAFYGDECSNDANERRAERYAAELLITPEAYAAAEANNEHPWDIAEALGVTVDVVAAYQEQCLMRLGRRTYGRRWNHGLQGDRARQLSS